MQELQRKAEAAAASSLRDDADVDQKVSDAMTSGAGAQPSTSAASAAAAAAGYGTIPNGLPSGNDPHCQSLAYSHQLGKVKVITGNLCVRLRVLCLQA